VRHVSESLDQRLTPKPGPVRRAIPRNYFAQATQAAPEKFCRSVDVSGSAIFEIQYLCRQTIAAQIVSQSQRALNEVYCRA
jgi:hypothetical protein